MKISIFDPKVKNGRAIQDLNLERTKNAFSSPGVSSMIPDDWDICIANIQTINGKTYAPPEIKE